MWSAVCCAYSWQHRSRFQFSKLITKISMGIPLHLGTRSEFKELQDQKGNFSPFPGFLEFQDQLDSLAKVTFLLSDY